MAFITYQGKLYDYRKKLTSMGATVSSLTRQVHPRHFGKWSSHFLPRSFPRIVQQLRTVYFYSPSHGIHSPPLFSGTAYVVRRIFEVQIAISEVNLS